MLLIMNTWEQNEFLMALERWRDEQVENDEFFGNDEIAKINALIKKIEDANLDAVSII